MNNQPQEKRLPASDLVLSVHSIFHSIQGEGPFCGTPAVFVRLAGCNLQCPLCDTNYTTGRYTSTPANVLASVRELTRKGLVVITGGEPFRQQISPLVKTLLDHGYYVQIETNGTLAPPDDLDYCTMPDLRTGVYVVCSPKMHTLNARIYDVACCLKYITQWRNIAAKDGLPLTVMGYTQQVARPPEGWHRPIYLQPLDEKDPILNDYNLQATVDACMEFGHILQVQVHKIINME